MISAVAKKDVGACGIGLTDVSFFAHGGKCVKKIFAQMFQAKNIFIAIGGNFCQIK